MEETTMQKKDYKKPAQQVVMLQYRHQLLSGSLLSDIQSELDSEDAITIGDEIPGGEDFWAR